MKDRNMKHHAIIRNIKVWCCLNQICEEVSGVGTKSCRKGLEHHSRDLNLYLVGNRETMDGFKQKSEEGIIKRKQLPLG